MKRLLLVPKRVKLSGWVCDLCKTFLGNYGKKTKMYWCPVCRSWQFVDLSWARIRRFRHVKIEPDENFFKGTSLMVMNRRMNKFLEDHKTYMDSQVTVYTSENCSQEFLKSLIPSLKDHL